MSTFQKTCISPDSGINTILNKPILKLVVIGDHEDIVSIADNLALYPPMNTERYVIWYPLVDANLLMTKFPGLSDVGNIVAFSLSKTNKVADIIAANETADYVRIDYSFTKAGAAALN
ncbi:hypothetical protein AMR72_13215 [Flavobacterium psychrophilum]|nr:hypothetical protein AMR72_13215 [Flavobacterium psychrophilum]AOE53392.1 hypothetical protein ALW18_13205 [Flavobacterium psychrophilum]